MLLIWSELRPQPLSLSVAEINTEHDRPRDLRPPVALFAWLHFPSAAGIRAVRLRAEVDSHNSRCVHLRGTLNAVGWTAWVWANSVTRIQPKPPVKSSATSQPSTPYRPRTR